MAARNVIFILANLALISATVSSSVDPCPAVSHVSQSYTEKQIRSAEMVSSYGYPILLFICTLGNIITLVVMSREKPICPTNVYMSTLAVADLFVLWLFLPEYFMVLKMLPKSQRHALRPSYFAYEGLGNWAQQTAMQLSDWTIIIFSLVRLLAVLRPFDCRGLQTVRTAQISAGVLLCLAGLFNLSSIVNYYYMGLGDADSTQGRVQPVWLYKWNVILQPPALVLMNVFKVLAIFLLNVITMVAIRRQRTSDVSKQRLATASSGQQESNSSRKYRNSNILLLCTVAIYLVFRVPITVISTISYYDTCIVYISISVRKFASPFLLTGLLASYSLNFFMYVTFSHRFRAQFLQTFTPSWCARRLIKRTTVDNSSALRKLELSLSNKSVVTVIRD